MALVLLGGLKIASAAKAVAVGSFEGSFAEDVRQNAVEAINDAGELRVVKDKAADRVGINEPKGAYADNAHTLGVAGILVGVVSDNNDEWSVLLAVYGPDGDLLQKFRVRGDTADALNTKLRALLPGHLAELLEDIEAPPPRAKAKAKPKPVVAAVPAKKHAEQKPPAKPAPEEPAEPSPEGAIAVTLDEEPSPEDEAEDEADAGVALSPLELHMAFGYATRAFAYTDSATPNLDVANAGWSWVSTLRLYPVALVSSGFVANLGLEVGVEQGFPNRLAADVTDPDGAPMTLKFEAETTRLFVGPRLRIPLGRQELGVALGYGTHKYRVHGDENLDVIDPIGQIDPCFLNSNAERTDVPAGGSCVVPDVEYSYLRAGFDARFRFGKLAVGVRGGYRLLLEAGEVEEPYWFGGAKGGAFEAGVMAGYALSDSVLGMVGFDYTGYRLKFDEASPERASEMAGGPLATGAKDSYMHIWVGAIVIVPGLD